MRHDRGDAESGVGLEVGGSLRYVNPARGLTLEGRGRMLVTHQDDYDEWGIGGLIRIAPGAGGRGLALNVEPTWGEAASGVHRLYAEGTAPGAAPHAAASATGRLDAELGYGLPIAGSRVVTPFGGFSMSGDGARRYRVGGRLAVSPSFVLSLAGERLESTAATNAEHGVMLQGVARW